MTTLGCEDRIRVRDLSELVLEAITPANASAIEPAELKADEAVSPSVPA